MTVVIATRAPGPIVVVIDPAAIVVRGPTPWLITNPRPAVWRTPGPVTITIRGPVVIVVNYGRMRSPDPTVVACICPIAISIEIFGAPNIAIVVLNVIAQSLSQIMLAFFHPVVPGIRGGGCK
jgi:hypothetical protein